MTDQFTRPCEGGCGDESPHNAHLTAAGRARYTKVPQGQNIFQDSTSVSQLLGELAGFASVCWQETGDYVRPDKRERIFDSERAQLAVEHAEARLRELLKDEEVV